MLPGPHPAVIFFHGGFWRNTTGLDQARPLCAALAQAGAAVWNLEYRQAGRSRRRLGGYVGRRCSRRSTAGCPWPTRYNLDLKRVIAAGHLGRRPTGAVARGAASRRSARRGSAGGDFGFAARLGFAVGWRRGWRAAGRISRPVSRSAMPPLLPRSCCRSPVPQRMLHGTADQSSSLRYEPAVREGVRERQADPAPGRRRISS